MGELRVGIVGAGWIGETHAATLAGLDGVRLVARADARPGRAEYVDWRELIARERLDAVLVCTPPDAHRDIAVAAAAAGLAVYLEKPVAHRAEDAQAIAEGVAAAGVVCAVGYQYRAIDFLADLPRDATLLAGTGVSDTVERPWLGDRKRGGGTILERASHLVDLQRLLAGDVAAVSAVEEGDVVALALRFASGAVGSVAVARARTGPGWRLELVAGDTVTLELDPVFRVHGAGLARAHAGPPPLQLSLACFIDAAARHDPAGVCCPLHEGIATLTVALAAQASAQRGVTVGLSARNA